MAAITPIEPATLGAELQRAMSKLVRMLMARDGLNQQQLGERIGMDQTTVSARLRGVSRWTVEDLTRLSMTFHVHPGEFWTYPKDFTPGISGGVARRGGDSTPASTKWSPAQPDYPLPVASYAA